MQSAAADERAAKLQAEAEALRAEIEQLQDELQDARDAQAAAQASQAASEAAQADAEAAAVRLVQERAADGLSRGLVETDTTQQEADSARDLEALLTEQRTRRAEARADEAEARAAAAEAAAEAAAAAAARAPPMAATSSSRVAEDVTVPPPPPPPPPYPPSSLAPPPPPPYPPPEADTMQQPANSARDLEALLAEQRARRAEARAGEAEARAAVAEAAAAAATKAAGATEARAAAEAAMAAARLAAASQEMASAMAEAMTAAAEATEAEAREAHACEEAARHEMRVSEVEATLYAQRSDAARNATTRRVLCAELRAMEGAHAVELLQLRAELLRLQSFEDARVTQALQEAILQKKHASEAALASGSLGGLGKALMGGGFAWSGGSRPAAMSTPSRTPQAPTPQPAHGVQPKALPFDSEVVDDSTRDIVE